MNYKSYQDLSNDVYANIHKLQGHGYDLVVGIPRSGMIPAYMIALLLNVCCVDLDSFLNNSRVGKGSTRKVSKWPNNTWDANKVLLVDDSLKTGGSMREAVEEIESRVSHDVTRLAIYVEKQNLKHTDIHFEVLPGPRIYQWNLFHNSIMHHSCMELEGVLCVKPTHQELQEEKAYIKYVSGAKPLVSPAYQVQTILTSRPEKYREQTMQWLEEHNIECERLEMSKTMSDKGHPGLYMSHKADYYKASGARLFIEMGEEAARRIAELSGKPVLCLGEGKMILPGMMPVARHGKHHLVMMAWRKCQRRFFLAMPDSTISVMRKVYRTLVR